MIIALGLGAMSCQSNLGPGYDYCPDMYYDVDEGIWFYSEDSTVVYTH